MATQVQLRRGTSTENNSFTGAQGELTFDTTNKRVRVHDGGQAGGFVISTADASGNVNIDGTVTADGLTVDGAGTFNAVDPYIRFNASTSVDYNIGASSAGGFYVYDVTNAATRFFADDNGDISFYESTGTTPKLQWSASNERLFLSGSDYQFGIGQGANQPWYTRAVSDGSYRIHLNGSGDIVTLNSSGQVGIGTSPDFPLHVSSTGVVLGLNATSGAVSQRFNENGTARFFLSTLNGSNGLAFVNGDGISERMRIDSSGNLLVGTTDDVVWNNSAGTSADNGHNLRDDGRAGFSYFNSTAGANATVNVNRTGSDGDLLRLFKDGTTVGSIGVYAGDYLTIGEGGSAGVVFHSTSVRPWNLTTNAANDDDIDLGALSARFDDIYATNGTIQTSDRNEKQDIDVPSDAEQRVAVACKGLLRKFRWIDAVAEKGDDARIHFGIIAQDLQDAFAAEGLDAGRYAMFISSTWWEATETYTDDDGVEQTRVNTYETAEEAPEGATERTRLGVRYPELLAFIIAAI